MKPTPAKPRIIIAQVEGSGTAAANCVTTIVKAPVLSLKIASLTPKCSNVGIADPVSKLNVCCTVSWHTADDVVFDGLGRSVRHECGDTKRKFVIGSPGEGGQAPGRKQIESIVVKIGQGLTYARNGNRDDATICSNRDAAIWSKRA
jgi:hypothetical protein